MPSFFSGTTIWPKRIFGGAIAFTTVTTDASANPTTAQFVIPQGSNGYRIWTSATPVSEDSFFLYKKANNGSAVACKMYRWQGRVFAANPGDVIKLGTVDGRTVYAAPVSAPTSLVVPSGASGTANADAAGPPDDVWLPASAHVTLKSFNQTINLSATDATSRQIFVREFTGTVWTPTRSYWLPATGSINVLCTYKQIALANYAGVAITVAAPTGATIGGTSHVMTLPFPAVTGQSRSCTTWATLISQCAAAVSGDEIVLSAGTYTMTSSLTETNFTANIAAGHKGMGGITIRGATGLASDVVLTSGATAFVFNVNNTTDTTVAGVKDLSLNAASSTNAGGIFGITDGHWLISNITVTGPGTSNNDQITIHNDTSGPVVADFLNCTSTSSFGDCWSTSGGATFNPTSLIRVINCHASLAGGAANDQLFTCHSGLAAILYGGTWSDANTSGFANDSATTPAYAFFAIMSPGARQFSIQFWNALHGCSWNLASADSFSMTAAGSYACFNNVTITGYTAATSFLRSVVATPLLGPRNHNLITSLTGLGKAYFPTVGGSSDFNGNIVSGFSVGFTNASYSSGSTVAINVIGNTFVNANVTPNDTTVNCNLKNNAFTAASGFNIVSGGATTTGNYNTYNTESGYTAGANDTAGNNAAINATTFVPTLSGNCDRNGDATDVTWCGDSDPYGWVLVHKTGSPSRGARELPGVYSGADLYPDVWA